MKKFNADEYEKERIIGFYYHKRQPYPERRFYSSSLGVILPAQLRTIN